MNENFKKYQPPGETWEDRALKDNLQPVLDPTDTQGVKNEYINIVHKAALSQYLLLCANDTILDFGCGVGRLTSFLGRNGARVIGIDITPSMIEKARRRYPEQTFIHYDGGKLPFEDNSLDHIVSVFVLQHITSLDDLNRIAKEFIRCLKKGGRIHLIEQVSKDNSDYYLHRLPQDYLEAFKDCKCVYAKPIRRSKSLFLSLIYRGLMPQFLFPTIAQLELLMAKNKKIPPKSYLDYSFVFQKE